MEHGNSGPKSRDIPDSDTKRKGEGQGKDKSLKAIWSTHHADILEDHSRSPAISSSFPVDSNCMEETVSKGGLARETSQEKNSLRGPQRVARRVKALEKKIEELRVDNNFLQDTLLEAEESE
jgi:hypothetical protein